LQDLAIVILNYNGISFLKKFLPKVIEYSPNASVYVADNSSTDNSVNFLKEYYPNVGLIINKENGGFAKGYNDALNKVESKYFLLLNSDIEVTENWLTPLLEVMKDETVAGCQPKVLSYSNKNTFEHAGASGGYLDRNYYPFCRGRILEIFEEDKGQYNGKTEIFWATGASLLIRSDIFKQVGGFDEAFFAHMEEIDLCWRIKKRGYKFIVEPSSIIYHVGGGTLSYNSPKKLYLNFRNSLFMLVKNHEGLLFPKLFYRLFLDGVAAVHFLLKGELKSVLSVLNAHVSLYANIGKLLKQRRDIKKQTIKFNPVGFYNASILWARYFKGIKKFSDLNKRFFQ
jgi:GT2 family glycosyltransferase